MAATADANVQELDASHSPDDVHQFRTYPGRYYVIIVAALLCMHQNLVWITFGPIPDEAKDRYGLTDIEITLLPGYTSMELVLFTIPLAWFLNSFGRRVVGVGSAWMLVVGCGIRVFIPFVPNAHTWIWLMHVGHILIGFAGLHCMIMPSKVSATWFPPHQRSFATALVTNAQGFGVGFGFLLNSFLTEQFGIRTMLEVQTEMAVFIALLATIYFPSEPPTPPSFTASEERSRFLDSLKQLLLNRNYWLLIISGGLMMGAISGFLSVLGIILNPTSGFNNLVVVHSLDEFFYSVAWLGAVSLIMGSIVGQVIGYYADRFQRKFKLIILLFLAVCTGFSLWFSLSLYGYGSKNPVNYFISFTLVNVGVVASFPIFYEAVVECTYPVSEENSTAGLVVMTNGAMLTFAVIGMAGVFSQNDPGRAKAMTWVLTGLLLLSILLILLFTENYSRLDRDDKSAATVVDRNLPIPRVQASSIQAQSTEPSPLIHKAINKSH